MHLAICSCVLQSLPRAALTLASVRASVPSRAIRQVGDVVLVFVFVFVVVRGEALRVRNMLVRLVIHHLVSVRTRLRTSIYNARGISMRGYRVGRGYVHDSGVCRISHAGGRYMTNRLGMHILRMHSMSCVNLHRLHLASSRICRTFFVSINLQQMHGLTRRRKLDMRRPYARARGGPEIYSRP